MAESYPPEVLKALFRVLRILAGCSQEELAAEAHLDPSSIYRAEAGLTIPLRKTQEKVAAAVGLPVSVVEACLLPALAVAVGARAPFTDQDYEGIEQAAAALDRLLSRLGRSAVAAFLAALPSQDEEPWERTGPWSAEDRRLQADVWARLEPCTAEEIGFLVESCPEFQRWWVAERLSHQSADAASDDVDRASKLAELAHRVAELAPGDPAERSRLAGYTLVFLNNCLRVRGDVEGAGAGFARGLALWDAGADGGLLAEWRLLDLEGSLRRDQRRFPEALDRFKSALACAPPEAKGRVLINKAFTLEQKGKPENAIEVLREAAPLVQAQGDPRLLFALWFNWTADLCLLSRYTQADRLLPRVRALAERLRKSLHSLRVRWLGALVDAGLERTEQATTALEQVRLDFEARGMAYDSALATVRLSMLYLKQGRTAEVQALALWMESVFQERGIHREAMAALLLFCESVRREAATAELAGRLFDYLQRARHDPELRFTSP